MTKSEKGRGKMTTPLRDELEAKDLRYQEMVGKLERVRESVHSLMCFCNPTTAKFEQDKVCSRCKTLTLLSEIMKDE